MVKAILKTWLMVFILAFVCFDANGQSGRRLWAGDAYVVGDFAASAISGQAVTATDTVEAATFVFSASSIQLNVGVLSGSDDGKALIYDATNEQFIPETVSGGGGSVASLDDIGNVNTSGKSSDDVLYWNGSIWSATPQASGGGGGSVASLDDIGDVSSVGAMTGDLITWTGSQWDSRRIATILDDLDDLGNVNTSGKSSGDVPYWTGSIWSATPQASGGGGGTGGPRSKTVVVAAADSGDTSTADYVCSGTADQATIRAAINSLDQTIGGTVQLLDGHYYFDAMLEIATNNISLVGQGPGATTLIRGYNEPVTDRGIILAGDFGDTENRIFLGNFSIDGNRHAYNDSNNHNILFVDLVDSGLYNIHSYDAQASGVWVQDTGNGCFVRDLYIENNLADGFNAPSGVANLVADHVVSVSNGIYGFDLSSIDSCIFAHCEARDGLNDGFNVGGNRSVFAACIAKGNASEGFYINSNWTLIQGCSATDNTLAGIRVAGSNATLVSSLSENNADGFYIETGDRIKVTGCTAANNSDNGIEFWNLANFCSVSNCLAYNNSDNGLEARAVNDLTILGNTFVANGNNEVRLGNSNQSINRGFILNNYMYDQANYSVEVVFSFDIVIKGNVFQANTSSGEANPPINIDDYATGDAADIYIENNIYAGDWSAAGADYDLDFGQAIKPVIQNQDTVVAGAAHEVRILSSSSTAKIGLATDDASTITNVITVSSGASTNPIANSWDLWSDPRFKKNITDVDAVTRDAINSTFDALQFIQFDWAYPYGPPNRAKYEDSIDDKTGEIIKSATNAYNDDLARYEADKTAFESLAIKRKQLSLDIEDPGFPDELATYDDQGNKVGINLSQLLIRTLIVLDRAKEILALRHAEIDALEDQVATLEDQMGLVEKFRSNTIDRLDALEAAVFP